MKSVLVAEHIGLLEALLPDWTNGRDGLERQLLRLEVHGDDARLLDDLFERVHRIKRGAAYAGLTGITMITHEMEEALHAIRAGEVKVDADLIDQLLSASDILHECLEQLGRKLRDRGGLAESGEWTIEMAIGDRWHGVVRNLHQRCAAGAAAKTPDAANGRGGSEPDSSGASGRTKEQLLFDICGHLDRMMSDGLAKLSRDGNDRAALDELLATVRCIKTDLEELSAFLPADAEEPTHLADSEGPAPRTVDAPANLAKLADALHRFVRLLELVRDKRQPFRQDCLALGRELAGDVKAALDAAATGEEAAGLHADLPEKIRQACDDLASLRAAPISAEERSRFSADGDQAAALAHKAPPPQSIRVSQDKLDKLMNMISELLIAKNGFVHLSSKLNREYDLPELSKEVKEVGLSINRISDELQNAVISIRMVEVKTVFQRMPRIVHDVAQATGKKIELVMTGENTEIDKTIIEIIGDPIVHMIRNAADHGIEHPEERLRKGKPEAGKIALRAYNRDKQVYIEIEDDGKGIDPAEVRRKALERGFITPEAAEKMTAGQLINLIFLPGFSTARKITELSGRGVGMDIVRKNIEKTGGSISIISEIDKGTKMVIRLPLTIRVFRGLVVDVLHETYIIPIDHIVETVKIRTGDLYGYNGRHFVCHKGEVIGVEWLAKLFLLGGRNRDGDELNAVIVMSGAEKFGLIVDRLKNEQEFVIKPLEGPLAGIPGLSGSTLLGDGRVALIVNPADLIKMANG